MGLRLPSPVRCLNLSEQIAQKLHACTGSYSAGRARDVLDILLIDMLGKLDAKKVRAAAEQVFEERATHAFPPTVQIAAEWQPELEVLAKDLGYPMTSATEIEARFRAFVVLLARGGGSLKSVTIEVAENTLYFGNFVNHSPLSLRIGI